MSIIVNLLLLCNNASSIGDDLSASDLIKLNKQYVDSVFSIKCHAASADSTSAATQATTVDYYDYTSEKYCKVISANGSTYRVWLSSSMYYRANDYITDGDYQGSADTRKDVYELATPLNVRVALMHSFYNDKGGCQDLKDFIGNHQLQATYNQGVYTLTATTSKSKLSFTIDPIKNYMITACSISNLSGTRRTERKVVDALEIEKDIFVPISITVADYVKDVKSKSTNVKLSISYINKPKNAELLKPTFQNNTRLSDLVKAQCYYVDTYGKYLRPCRTSSGSVITVGSAHRGNATDDAKEVRQFFSSSVTVVIMLVSLCIGLCLITYLSLLIYRRVRHVI
ncbi:MAG: hypothetical protein QM703_27785 [Gemmatales bacterium]